MPRKDTGKGFTAADLAKRCGGIVEGASALELRFICASEDLVPNALSFIRGSGSREAREVLPQLDRSALLVPRAWKVRPAPPDGSAYIVVDNPIAAMVDLIPLFFSERELGAEISPKADIHPTAHIGTRVRIGAFASIGAEAKIGDDCLIYPHATLYPGVELGKSCVVHSNAVIREDCRLADGVTIHPGAVIGADGFGYFPDPKKGLRKVPQIGNVEIAQGVEIGANTCVDRATFGSTRIGAQTKLDNLVQIGHNVLIGTHTIICGQAAIAGSTRIGNQVTLGGQVGVGDHVRIADGIRVAAQSGVSVDLETKGDYGGFPAIPVNTWRRQRVAFEKLPKLLKELKLLRNSDDESSDQE